MTAQDLSKISKPARLDLVNPITGHRCSLKLDRPLDYSDETMIPLGQPFVMDVEIFKRLTEAHLTEADLVDMIHLQVTYGGDPERLGAAQVEFYIDGDPTLAAKGQSKPLLRDLLGKALQLPHHVPGTLCLFDAMVGDRWVGYMAPGSSSLSVRVTGLPAEAAQLVLGTRILTHRYTSKA